MSIWSRLTERVRHGAERARHEGAVRRVPGELEPDKARREAQMSGEGFTVGAGTGEFPASRTGSDEPVRGSEEDLRRS